MRLSAAKLTALPRWGAERFGRPGGTAAGCPLRRVGAVRSGRLRGTGCHMIRLGVIDI